MNDSDMDLASGIAAFEAKEFRRAFQLLVPLAARGEPEAQFRVAVMCRNGLGGVANEALAFSTMRDAARQGHGLAQHGLGVMYLYGECVEKDEAEAAAWFRRAADQGLAGCDDGPRHDVRTGSRGGTRRGGGQAAPCAGGVGGFALIRSARRAAMIVAGGVSDASPGATVIPRYDGRQAPAWSGTWSGPDGFMRGRSRWIRVGPARSRVRRRPLRLARPGRCGAETMIFGMTWTGDLA